MKRIFTLLILFVATAQMIAQAPSTNPRNSRRPLWVGLDMGGTWQASDMAAKGGIGWSFTLSRYSKLDKTGPLYFGWRFRFLDGRNYGYNYHRLYGLGTDPVMSTGLTNYNTPTANNDGYVFSNYKFRFDEFAYEIIIGSNGLRKHGVLVYGFGGIGATHWKTTTNQLDAFDNQYDYSSVSTGGNSDIVYGDLESIWSHGNYETIANGSTSTGKWGFMPSAGVGFGYQFGNAVALGVEHRTTWALNDNIDGVNHSSDALTTPTKDLYNYDGFFVRWTFGGGNSHSNNTNNNVNNNVPPNPNNYTNNNQIPPNNTNTTVITPPNNNNQVNNQPTVILPTVRFDVPNVNPYTASVQTQQLVVRVEHVTAANQIQLLINNQLSTSFSFNPNTNTMVFNHTLLNGTNVYQVTATNQYGSASDVQTINYGTVVNTNPQTLPPQVTITNPAVDPFTSAVASMNISATVLNVTTLSNVQVRKNGNAVSNFSFNPNTHLVTFTASLSTGSNLYEVIGTNSVGSASDHVTINYNPVAAVQPPVVTITSPSSCPYTVKTNAFTITANITNVTAANQVSIVFNNQGITQFNFVNNASYATVSFPVTLVGGSNPFTITGTNSGGSNTKSCDIILKTTQAPPVVPPSVNITNPSSSPFTSPNQSFTVIATVLNVASQNEISVTMNNALVSNWNYNMGNHVLMFPTTLNVGTNVYTIAASNVNGSDAKSTTIIYSPAPVAPPVVNITIPSANPFISTTSPVMVTAEVLNVTMANQITVKTLTGTNVPFSFNGGSHLVTFTANLVSGANYYNVTATNSAGTASDNTTIKYVSSSGGTDANTPGSNPGGSSRPGGNTITTNNNQSSSSGISVSLLSPTSSPYTSTVQEMPITMTVLGVNAQSEISVRLNGVHVMNFVYNATTHVVSFNVSYINGENTILVAAQNSTGSASKTLIVNYNSGGGRSSSPGSSGNQGTGGKGETSKPKSTTSTTTTTTKPTSTTSTTTTTKPNTTSTSAPATTSESRPTSTKPAETTVKPR